PAVRARLRDLARRLSRLGPAGRPVLGVFWDEVAGRRGPARTPRGGQHDPDWPGFFSLEHPLSAGLVAFAQGPPRQQVPAARGRRGRGPAAALYLRAAAATAVRQ